jgi:hypothetical protein
VTFEQATVYLVDLARRSGGVVKAGVVETDPALSVDDQTMVSAAAHALASSTNVFATPNEEGWFPYEEIRVTDLR